MTSASEIIETMHNYFQHPVIKRFQYSYYLLLTRSWVARFILNSTAARVVPTSTSVKSKVNIETCDWTNNRSRIKYINIYTNVASLILISLTWRGFKENVFTFIWKIFHPNWDTQYSVGTSATNIISFSFHLWHFSIDPYLDHPPSSMKYSRHYCPLRHLPSSCS